MEMYLCIPVQGCSIGRTPSPYIYTMEIVQQDSSSFVAWQYDKIGKSGISINTLDETYKDNILYIRAHVDSKSTVTSSWFSKCKKI